MRFQRRSGGRLPYGTIYMGDLTGEAAPSYFLGDDSIKQHLSLPPNTPVFVSGDRPRRIVIHRHGRVLLYCSTGAPEVLDARSTFTDQIFGLIEYLSDGPYRLSMRTLSSCEFDVIRVVDFLHVIRQNPDVCFRFSKILSRLCRSEVSELRSH